MPATAVSEPAGDTSGSARLILVGRVTGPYGVRGWVKIEPFTELPESLLEYRGHWRMGRDEPGPRWKPVVVNEAALHSGNVIALIDDCPHRESALQLKGMGIAVPRTMLPQAGEGEFYQADLVGLDVENEAGEPLGRVSGMFSNGGHDVLRVQHAGGERLLPFVPPVVKAVDLVGGRIVVDWQSDW